MKLVVINSHFFEYFNFAYFVIFFSPFQIIKDKEQKIDLWGSLLVGISYFFLIFSFPFSLCACVKVAQEYER